MRIQKTSDGWIPYRSEVKHHAHKAFTKAKGAMFKFDQGVRVAKQLVPLVSLVNPQAGAAANTAISKYELWRERAISAKEDADKAYSNIKKIAPNIGLP